MDAIISDIHGNVEALDAVLADALDCGARDIFCLGDLVGYGPDPIACIERAMSWRIVLMGNFDQAAISEDDLPWSALAAMKTILKFRRQLKELALEKTIGDFLATRPTSFADSKALYVHGSPRNPLNEYLFPEEIYAESKMNRIAQLFDQLCFCGHTHIPGVFFINDSDSWDYVPPEDCDHRYEIGQSKIICNVGSVGQPRDGNPRACYVLYDGQTITFRRVEYDVDRTIQKIYDDADFDNFLGDRLGEGR